MHGGGSLEAFVKLNSWPADFTAPTDSAYLEIGGKKFGNIPSNILKGVTWVEDLSFDSAVKSIGRSAFENCTALTSIMFPQKLTQIGSAAFKGCTAIKEITLPEQLKSIGNEAFSGTQLNSIAFPSSMIHLGTQAFAGCQLDSVHYKNQSQDVWVDSTFFMSPNSKTSMASNKNLTNLIALNGVTHIPENAFSGCSNLHYISFPSTLTSIGLGAFNGCQNINRIDYGNQTNAQDLLLDTVENGEVVGKTLFAGTASVGGKYRNNQELKEIVNLNTLENINSYAFENCSTLSSIIFPCKQISIKDYAFQNCTNLIDVSFQNSLITILDSGVFRYCTNLQSITLPPNLTELRGAIDNIDVGRDNYFGIFDHCSNLKSIDLPDTVFNIGPATFRYCSSLTSIKMSPIVQTIGNYAFQYCSKLQSIDLPETLTTIGIRAFENCQNLTSIKIPESITVLEAGAFRGCSNLQSISLSAQLTEIKGLTPEWGGPINGYAAYGAFENCSSLSDISLPDSITTIQDRAFCNCTGLIQMTFPQELTALGTNALANCYQLENLNLSRVNNDVVNAINWSNAFGGTSGLNRILIVTCTQEQVEKVQTTFPNATLEIVD